MYRTAAVVSTYNNAEDTKQGVESLLELLKVPVPVVVNNALIAGGWAGGQLGDPRPLGRKGRWLEEILAVEMAEHPEEVPTGSSCSPRSGRVSRTWS